MPITEDVQTEALAKVTNVGFDREQLDAHRIMVLWLFLATIVLIGGITAALLLARFQGQAIEILPIVVMAGGLGGFVSCLRRLYAFEDLFPRRSYAALFRRFDLYIITYSTIPPVIGMIAAALVYVLFSTHVIGGHLFPTFACSPTVQCDTLPAVLEHWRPHAATDYAKAVVWGFVAGFSERFFVDILDRFAKEGPIGK